VLDSLHARAEFVSGLIRIDREFALQNTGSTIKFFSDKMYSAAMPGLAGVQHALVRIKSRVIRQQCRVNIEDTSRVVADEPWTQDAHEAREHEQVGLKFIQFCGDCTVIVLPVRVLAVLDTHGGDFGLLGSNQSNCIRLVAEHNCQVEADVASGGAIDK